MSRIALLAFVLAASTGAGVAAQSAPTSDDATAGVLLLPEVDAYVNARISEFDAIPAERKGLLEKLSKYVSEQRSAGKPVRLTFICTHNSRRSHLAQVWAAIAADYYGLERVATYSGGTEATAFYPSAIDALRRAGVVIDSATQEANPRYLVRWGPKTKLPITCFSKVYHEEPNPQEDFCAVMTCTQADEACPTVLGASLRLAIPYEDPKAADGTPEESSKYDERCAQIAREMLYAFSQAE